MSVFCQYECNQFSGKSHLQNDLFCVENNVNFCLPMLSHSSLIHKHNLVWFFISFSHKCNAVMLQVIYDLEVTITIRAYHSTEAVSYVKLATIKWDC